MSARAAEDLAPPTGMHVLAIGPSLGELLLGCGGALAHAHAAGDPVFLLTPPGDTPEARQAAIELTGGELLDWAPANRDQALDRALVAARPGRVYCPSPLEREAPRLDCWRALEAALGRAGPPHPDIALYEIAERLRHNHRVDVTGVIVRKDAALGHCRPPADLRDLIRADRVAGQLHALDLHPRHGFAEAFFLVRGEEASSGLEALARWAIWAPDRPVGGPGGAVVSVIVRTRDRPERLREALGCLVVQTYPALEIVLVDGGRASAWPVAAPFAARRPIVHLAVDPGTTRGAALNAGVARSTGRWICYLDDDDAVLPHHVATLVAALESGPHRAAYVDGYTVSEVIGPDGAIERRPRQLEFSRAYSRAALLAANYVPIHCCMHDRELLELAGGFDETLSGYEDWDLWIRITRTAPLFHVARATAEYRLKADAPTRATLAPSSDEARALDTIRARYAVERAAAWEDAYDELLARCVESTRALEPLRLELEQLRGKCFGLEREVEELHRERERARGWISQRISRWLRT